MTAGTRRSGTAGPTALRCRVLRHRVRRWGGGSDVNGRPRGHRSRRSGGVIANAAVELRELETNQSTNGVTDGQGVFRFTECPLAHTRFGWRTTGSNRMRTTESLLAIGQTARLNVVMRPAGVIESVAVSAQPPPLDSRQTSVTTTIDTERIEELPVRSRNYLEFVLLAPGVTRPERQTAPGAVTSTLPDSGFSFGGLRPRSNTLTIDGLDNNDEFSGSTRTELSLEFVREFQVVTQRMVGRERWRIRRWDQRRDQEWRQHAPRRRVPVWSVRRCSMRVPSWKRRSGRRHRCGGIAGGLAVGGPLVKDRTFYYAAAEREQTHDETASDIDADAASAINRALSAGLLPQVAHATADDRPVPDGTRGDGMVGEGHASTRRPWCRGWTDRRDSQPRRADAFNTGGLEDRSVARHADHA